jgi:hypothetical protein
MAKFLDALRGFAGVAPNPARGGAPVRADRTTAGSSELRIEV